MKTYKEQQEEKGLVFKPFQSPMCFYLRTVALNPNQKIDYYEVAGTWITKEEDERREKQDKRFNILLGIFCITSYTVIVFITLFVFQLYILPI